MKHTSAALMKRLGAPLLIACLALAGCSTPQAPRLHSLLSSSAATPATVVAPAFTLEMAPVAVPSAVDQAQWVVRMPDDTLRMLEQEQWASSLREELRAALGERLIQRWGAVDARTAAGSVRAGWRVSVDVQRFESVAGKQAWLASTWSAVPIDGKGSALSCSSSLHEAVMGDITAMAAAHRRAVVRLADQIGTALSSLARGEAAVCGAPAA